MSDIWHDPLFLAAVKKGGAGGTASGDIVTFNAPKAAPLKALTLSIDLVQDLHGYDSPWPAGGGKNLLNWTNASTTIRGVTFTVNSDGSIIVNGTADDGDASFYSSTPSDLPFTAGSYILSGCPSGGSSTTYFLNETSGSAAQDVGNGATIVLNEGRNIRIRIVVRDGVTVNNLVFWPMIRLSSISDATYAPYSNLCPISGWDGAQVWRTGRNLVNVTPTLDGNRYVTFFGNHSVGDATTGIFLKAGTYTLSVSNPQGVNVGVYGCYLDDHAQITISGNGTQTTKTGTLTLTKDRVLNFWLYFNVAGANYTDGITVQLELGTTPTPYTPYTGTTIPVTFTEAGTVYGGVWDVLNGVLTVDRAKYTIDSTTPIAQIADNRDGNLRIKYASGIPAYKVRASGICSAFPVITTETAYNYAPSNCVFYSNGVFVMPPAGVEHTEQAYLQWLTSVGAIEVVMELATPITIPLTPQEISTLAGQNVVWGDAGEVDLEYAGGGVSKDMMLAAILHEARQ